MAGNRKMLALLLAAMLVIAVAGCTKGGGNTTNSAATPDNGNAAPAADPSASPTSSEDASNLPPLTYNMFTFAQNIPTWIDPKDDVVSQYIKKKFNIEVKDISYLQGMTFKERMNLFVASNELPDVIAVYGDTTTVPATGQYVEMGDLLKQYAPNFMKLVPENYWSDALYDGKLYSFGSPVIDGADYPDDPYALPNQNWNLFFTTEGVLAKAGYTFTPLAEINKQINESGKKATPDMYKIEPEIKTPDDFYQFLKKIKEVMPKVNGQDVIPFSIPLWLEPHFGATFGLSGWWKYDPATMDVSSFLSDDDQSKAYWQFMNKLYKEGLIDKDFAIQKDEQLNDKILQGRVKAFMWSSSWPSNQDVQTAVKKADPNDTLRAIPLPKAPGSTFEGVDHIGRTTIQFYIRKDFKDIPRLIQFWDWGLSPEARDLFEWGPEELGLWHMEDGKKVWNDDMLKAMRSQDEDYLKTHFYSKGLGGGSDKITYAMPLAGGYNPNSWQHSYKYEVAPDDYTTQNSILSIGGNDTKGYLSPGSSEATNKIPDFIFGEFEQQYSARLFAAKNDQDFQKNWDELQKYFNDRIGYPAAQKEMKETFKSRGFDVADQ